MYYITLQFHERNRTREGGKRRSDEIEKNTNSMRGKKRAKKTIKGCKKEKEEQERKRER